MTLKDNGDDICFSVIGTKRWFIVDTRKRIDGPPYLVLLTLAVPSKYQVTDQQCIFEKQYQGKSC